MAHEEVRVIIGDTDGNADLYYATRFTVGVPVAYLEIDAKKILLLGDLEYGRARAEAKVDEIVSTNSYEKTLSDAKRSPTLAAVVDLFLEERFGPEGIHPTLVAPAALALGYAESLREFGYEVKVKPDPFFPERTVKTPEELAAIEEVQDYAEGAMGLAVDAGEGAAQADRGAPHPRRAPVEPLEDETEVLGR